MDYNGSAAVEGRALKLLEVPVGRESQYSGLTEDSRASTGPDEEPGLPHGDGTLELQGYLLKNPILAQPTPSATSRSIWARAGCSMNSPLLRSRPALPRQSLGTHARECQPYCAARDCTPSCIGIPPVAPADQASMPSSAGRGPLHVGGGPKGSSSAYAPHRGAGRGS